MIRSPWKQRRAERRPTASAHRHVPGPVAGGAATALVLLFLLSAAPAAELASQEPAGGAASVEAPAHRPVVPPPAFRRAVAAGTRTEDGRPGPRYWQQEVDYEIQADLDPETGRVRGREVISYRNNSPDTLPLVVLHLDQNVFAAGARRNRRAPVTGGLTLEALRVDGRQAPSRHVGGSYYEALTLLQVQLPDPLPPGGETEIEVRWSFTVPPAEAFRTGNLDGEVFAVAQWYPRMAVYDDVYGWDLTPYLGDGEFYLEYGDFDVQLTLPAGWIVGATGTLQNAEEVLADAPLERLRGALERDESVRVVTEEEVREGRATRSATGTLTWRFRARDVRDFSFATSEAYLWDAAGVEVAGGERSLMQAFYRPGLTAWQRGVEYLAHTVRTLSEWIGPYPYPQLGISETSVGGMEYPMFIFNPSTNAPSSLAAVTVHEAAHQWFPMAVGTMEAKHAWMDEGIVSYWEEMSLAELEGRAPPRWGATTSYLRLAGSELEVPLMRHTDLVSPYGARTLAAYTKPAVLLGALREVMGEEAFLAAFQDFYRSWRSRHPQPWDFFNAMERHHGEDLDWFWDPFFFDTAVVDYGIASVRSEGGSTTVRIENRGQAALPTPVVAVLADGTRREERISHRAWLGGDGVVEVTFQGRAREVTVDPGELFPDVDRSDNRWRAP